LRPVVPVSDSIGLQTSAEQTSGVKARIDEMRLGLVPAINPLFLVTAALGFGLLLLLGSFWRRKPATRRSELDKSASGTRNEL